MPSFMCESLVIAAERCLVAHNIHIIRLVLNLTSAENVEVIQFMNVLLCVYMCVCVVVRVFPSQRIPATSSHQYPRKQGR